MSAVYAPPSAVRALLRRGRVRIEARLSSADMISVEEAALLMGEKESTIRRWIAQGHCIAVSAPGLGTRLPQWQFEDDLLLWIRPISQALDAKSGNGWHVLSFLETPHGGLGGRTPRQALEQGDVDRVLALASI